MSNVSNKVFKVAILGCLVSSLLVGCSGNINLTQQPIKKSQPPINSIVAGKLEPSLSNLKEVKDGYEFKYSVTNQTESIQKILFSSGQNYNVIVKNKSGDIVYNYEAVAMFTMEIREKTLQQGESFEYLIKIPKLESGIYSVEVEFKGKIDGNNPVQNIYLNDVVIKNSTSSTKKFKQTYLVQGDFVGWADNHTIEVIVEDGPVTFQVSEEVKNHLDMGNWKTGNLVKFNVGDTGTQREILDK